VEFYRACTTLRSTKNEGTWAGRSFSRGQAFSTGACTLARIALVDHGAFVAPANAQSCDAIVNIDV